MFPRILYSFEDCKTTQEYLILMGSCLQSHFFVIVQCFDAPQWCNVFVRRMRVCTRPIRTMVVFHKQPLCRDLMKTSGARPPRSSRGGIMEKSTCVSSRLRLGVWMGGRRPKSVNGGSFHGRKLFIVNMTSLTASTCCLSERWSWFRMQSIYLIYLFVFWWWMTITCTVVYLSLSQHLASYLFIHLWIQMHLCSITSHPTIVWCPLYLLNCFL